MAKKWYKSKTMRTNLMAVIGMVVAYWFDGASLLTALPVVGMGVVNMVLRIVTKQPLV